MSPRQLALLATASALAACLIGWLRTQDAASTPGTIAPTKSPPPSRAVANLLEPDSIAGTGAPAREPTRSEEEAHELGRELVVEVVRAATEEPVPGATVGLLRASSLPKTRGPALPNLTEYLDARILVQADERGRAVFGGPLDEELFLTASRTEPAGAELAGARPVRADEEPPLRLEVAPSATLRVRVVDPAGAPVANALVGLRGPRSAYAWESRITARTGALDGIASFPFLDELTAGQVHPEFVALEVPSDPVVAAPIPASPTEVLELVHPPTGSLRVRLLEPSGELVAHPYALGLTWYDGSGSRILGRSSAIVEAGLFTVDAVGLGLDLYVVDLHLMNLRREPPPLRHAGPRTAGETVEVDYRLPAGRWLRVRAVDAERRPVADEVVRLSIGPADTHSITDEQGVLFFFLDEERTRGPLHLGLETTSVRGSGQLRTQVLPPDGDLGEVTLGISPPALPVPEPRPRSTVRGTLLLPDGMPPSAVSVAVTRPNSANARPRGSTFQFATEPGDHHLTVSIARTRAELAAISFFAGEGVTTLDPIDLGPLVDVHVIEITDTRGRPLESGVLEVLPYRSRHEGARSVLVSRAGESLHLRARADGFRFQVAEGVQERHQFSLEPGLPVRIRFHDLPLEREHLVVALVMELESPSRLLGNEDELLFHLSAPGPCNVLMNDQRRDPTHDAAGKTPRPLTIDVLDLPVEQVFHVDWPTGK